MVAGYLILFLARGQALYKSGVYQVKTKEQNSARIAKVNAISPEIKDRAIQNLQGSKSTKAPDGVEKKKHNCVISGPCEIAQYQGKDTGLRINATNDTGKIKFFASIAPESKEKAKKLIEADSLCVGDNIVIEVYELVDNNTKENKGLYCRAIL